MELDESQPLKPGLNESGPASSRLARGSLGAAGDSELAAAAAAGDAAAFGLLLERHYDRFHRLAWRWCGNRSDAEDVAQEACIKIGQSIRSWRGEAQFSTWATRIVINAATDRIRSRHRMRLVEPVQMALIAETAAAAAETPPGLDAELWDAVRALPPQQRDAVLLVYSEEMSHAQAAEVLGCTEKTVSWHLHEARKRLKTALRGAGSR